MRKLNQRLSMLRAVRSNSGISLIELVVVVAILAILVAIAIPVYLNIQANAINLSVQTTLHNFNSVYQYEVVKGESASDALSTAMELSKNDITIAGDTSCVQASYSGDHIWHLILEQVDPSDPSVGTIASGAC